MAQKFLKESRFYLSWDLDFRGRMYSKQPWLSCQGTEMEKALVTFADGCKLDKQGEDWAACAIGADPCPASFE